MREKGLQELEEAVSLIKRTVETKVLSGDESGGLLEVITTYASTWVMLQKYDRQDIPVPKTRRAQRKFDYKFCREAISQIDEIKKRNARVEADKEWETNRPRLQKMVAEEGLKMNT